MSNFYKSALFIFCLGLCNPTPWFGSEQLRAEEGEDKFNIHDMDDEDHDHDHGGEYEILAEDFLEMVKQIKPHAPKLAETLLAMGKPEEMIENGEVIEGLEHLHELIEDRKKREFEEEVKIFLVKLQVQQGEKKYFAAKGQAKGAAKKALRELLEKLLDLKIAERERQIAELNKELEEMRAGLKSAKSRGASLVDQQLERITGQHADPFNW